MERAQNADSHGIPVKFVRFQCNTSGSIDHISLNAFAWDCQSPQNIPQKRKREKKLNHIDVCVHLNTIRFLLNMFFNIKTEILANSNGLLMGLPNVYRKKKEKKFVQYDTRVRSPSNFFIVTHVVGGYGLNSKKRKKMLCVSFVGLQNVNSLRST